MKTTTIETKKDIVIKKGTIIPMLTVCDTPLWYDIFIPKGSTLQDRQTCYITTKVADGTCTMTPYIPQIFKFIYDKAIADGGEAIITEDDKKVFKMFAMITENRIKPEEGNYITEFEAETIEEAEIIAKRFSKNMGSDFQYIIRQ